jgi:hypothetical protein
MVLFDCGCWARVPQALTGPSPGQGQNLFDGLFYVLSSRRKVSS